jgi:hypothetical protein
LCQESVCAFIKGAGLAITVDKSKQQVTFQTVDPKTKKPMKDWYMFNECQESVCAFSLNMYQSFIGFLVLGSTVWKVTCCLLLSSWHKWVSAMGQAFDYTFSLTTHKMTKIKDFHHNDITPQVKQMGFWNYKGEMTRHQAEAACLMVIP